VTSPGRPAGPRQREPRHRGELVVAQVLEGGQVGEFGEPRERGDGDGDHRAGADLGRRPFSGVLTGVPVNGLNPKRKRPRGRGLGGVRKLLPPEPD
jgi:hypothetical protein